MRRSFAVLLVGLAACADRGGSTTVVSAPAPAPTAAAPAAAAAPGEPAPARASKAFYRAELRAADAPCVNGQACRAVIELHAEGAYKVNAEYPFRFVPDATPGVSFGAERALARDGEKRATLDVEFTPAAAGPVTIAGVFKLSVCTESVCEIERPRLGITVQVK